MDRNQFIKNLLSLWRACEDAVQIKLEPVYANQIRLNFTNNNKDYTFFIPTDYKNDYETINFIALCVRDPYNASAKLSFYLNRNSNINKDFE
jgi:hypothetical protein